MTARQLRYLDLGGASPVEGYLTIHLSPVEAYGKVLTPESTMAVRQDPATKQIRLERRGLQGPAAVLHYDVTAGLPLRDEFLLGLNMSHFLEHLPLESGLRLLEECRRVLSPGGILRVSCPDLRRYATAYLSRNLDFYEQVGAPLYCNYKGLVTLGEKFISKAYDDANGHLWFYDSDTLVQRLHSMGFRQVTDCAVHDSSLPGICDIEPKYRAVESFYVEARR
jgi:SAM-dependent methyltransferase